MYLDYVAAYTEAFAPKVDTRTEADKVKEIMSQLKSSIDFLNHLIDKEKDQPTKSGLEKERTAAQWEIDRLTKELKKVQA